MNKAAFKSKFREWLKRYLPAEIIGTILAAIVASWTYSHTHSYIGAAGAGFVAEGIGFFGYFITYELLKNGEKYQHLPLRARIPRILAASSASLLVEFAPAELLDTLLIRPFMFVVVPQHVKPYALGFITGKLLSDVFFYTFAIVGYEMRKYLKRR